MNANEYIDFEIVAKSVEEARKKVDEIQAVFGKDAYIKIKIVEED